VNSLPISPRRGAADRQPRVLVFANQKGGVGKTTTTINLGTALAATGECVLIIDLDPQGNASTGLGIDHRTHLASSYHALVGERTLAQTIVPTAVPGLYIVPSTIDLLGVELEISGHPDRSFKLRSALAKLFTSDGCECAISYILIDCPPSLNLLTINALAAADAVVVPLQCEFFALEGLSQMLTTADQIRQSLNSKLIIHGIVLTMFDSRNSFAAQVVADVRAFMREKVYNTVIPRNVRISEAPSHGKPVLLYDLKCSGSQAYLKLASEMIQRESRLRTP
jgi:chromosome partitioning protein